jgi:hypothetical protein
MSNSIKIRGKRTFSSESPFMRVYTARAELTGFGNTGANIVNNMFFYLLIPNRFATPDRRN